MANRSRQLEENTQVQDPSPVAKEEAPFWRNGSGRDGCLHDWFERRDPMSAFMGYIDDATSNTLVGFILTRVYFLLLFPQ